MSVLPLSGAGLVFEGRSGPGRGKHIVLVSGDEEYRSEEALPQLAQILAKHHGFKCTVLFAIDPTTARSTRTSNNIPGLEALEDADLMVMFTRFRDLPDEQMKHIVDYVESGKPDRRPAHRHARLQRQDEQDVRALHLEQQGMGRRLRPAGARRDLDQPPRRARQAEHARASSRQGRQDHPILRGIKDGDIWGPTDVYGVRCRCRATASRWCSGQVLTGMKPTDPPLDGQEERPDDAGRLDARPTRRQGKTARVFTTTMGASQDLQSEGLRRLMVNACTGR